MGFLGFYDYTVILTYLSLLSAFSGMLAAREGNFTAAILCLLVCGICDAFDGAVARTKKNRTEDEKVFGIQIDSLCDTVSFGVFPAFLSICMGLDGILGKTIAAMYCLCAVIRLAFFNVEEGKRQQTEGGCNKTYRGLPITTSSIILPLVYMTRAFLPGRIFRAVLHIVMALTGFLFVLDFKVKKPDLSKMIGAK